ncbi:MAG: hypothetical protein ACF8Q5_04010 [Phycisphaerales bacterium JB040]
MSETPVNPENRQPESQQPESQQPESRQPANERSATGASLSPGNAQRVQPELDVFGRAPKGRPDWSHRKGEPRVFALMWMMYLMGASLLMVTTIAAVQSISPGVVRPAARAMLTTAAVGICVLWPMVRLSQRRPERTTLGAVAADLVVLLPPLGALALPQALTVLANWPMQVVLALLAGLTGWAVLLGAVLALALRTVGRGTGGAPEEWHRVLWTCLFALVALGPPVYHAIGGTPVSPGTARAATPAPGSAFSPISLAWDLMSDRSGMGHSGVVGAGHWVIVLRVWALALALWGAGIAARLARPHRDHSGVPDRENGRATP